MKSYEELFAQRGSRYDQAMRLYPEARDEEFLQVINRADIRSGNRVGDVPAGGGYLTRYLPDNVVWLPHETCHGFHQGNPEHLPFTTDLLPLPWGDNDIDVLLSIAGVHHIEDKMPLYREFFRVVKPGGHLVLSDVGEGSPVTAFLDDYVGRYNSTGHEGVWLNASTPAELEQCGWHIRSAEQVDFYWRFRNENSMVDFCHQLFDITRASAAQTLAAIDDYLGIHEFTDGTLGMKWSLLTIRADKLG